MSPCTFTYKEESGELPPQEAISSNKTELIQLGLIADDIKDSPLFNYIGSTIEYNKIVEEEEKDEQGNIVKESVTEKDITLGLKSLPLAVLGLVADKYLLNKVEELTSKVEELSFKIS